MEGSFLLEARHAISYCMTMSCFLEGRISTHNHIFTLSALPVPYISYSSSPCFYFLMSFMSFLLLLSFLILGLPYSPPCSFPPPARVCSDHLVSFRTNNSARFPATTTHFSTPIAVPIRLPYKPLQIYSSLLPSPHDAVFSLSRTDTYYHTFPPSRFPTAWELHNTYSTRIQIPVKILLMNARISRHHSSMFVDDQFCTLLLNQFQCCPD